MAKQPLYGITSDQARRIRRACERIEGTPPNSPLGDVSRGRFWNPGILRARVTTKIPAGSFHAPGSGEAQIYAADDSGVWRPEGDPVSVKNQFGGGDVDVPDSILITWVAGEWWLVAANCEDALDETEDPEPEDPGDEGGGGTDPEGPGGGVGGD